MDKKFTEHELENSHCREKDRLTKEAFALVEAEVRKAGYVSLANAIKQVYQEIS